MFRIKSLLSALIIISILCPDAVRCMENKDTEEFPITHSLQKKDPNTSTTGNSPENSDSFDDSLSPRKIEVTEVKKKTNSSEYSTIKELDKTSSEEKTEKSDSGGDSPQKTEQILNEETIKITPLNQEITSLSLESKKGEQTQSPLIIVIGGDESQKFSGKLGVTVGKGSPLILDIQKGTQEHNRSIILSDPTAKGDTKSSKKKYTGITFKDDTYYLDEESIPNVLSRSPTNTKLQNSEEGEDWNEKDKQDIKEIDFSSSQPNKKTKNKKKVEKDIFFIEEEEQISGDKNSSQQPIQKKRMVVEFLKESFSKLSETFKKIVPINFKKEESVSNSKKSLLINEDEEYTEESHLLSKEKFIDIEKEGSNQKKPLEECLKDILAEDEEQTALCFEEWYKTASDKTLCQELEVFVEQSVALGPLFAQDLENMLKENAGLKKITIQDWLNHMGLAKGDHKAEILSKEVIQFYELFNQALTYHIASTLFKDKIPEEDLEKFKKFLIHVKDYTIDGKLTWKQIAGALFGAAVAGVAAYAIYQILGYNLLDVFFYYNFDFWGAGNIARPVTRVLTGFIVLDAIVRNARIFIDYFSPDTTNYTISMDPKIAKQLKLKKGGAYGWSSVTSLITIYYYYIAATVVYPKLWGFAPFLYLNSIWDNSSRLVSNIEKGAQKKFLQKIEKDYPSELKDAQITLLKDLKKSSTSLKTADQKDINHYYDVVYHSILPQTKNIKTEDAKFAQVLHLLIFFLELEKFEAMEFTHEDSNPSSEVIQTSEKEEQESPLKIKGDKRITISTSLNIKVDKHLLIDSKGSSDTTQISDNQEEISFFEEKKNKEDPLLDPIEIKNVQQKKTTTWRSKIATGLSWALPIVGTTILFVGARYMFENVLGCPGFCWQNTAGVEALSDVGALLTWGAVSYVQKASIQKNIEDFPGSSKMPVVTSQRPVRVGWQLFNYVLGAFLAIPDFMLWANATVKWKSVPVGLKYTGIAFATGPEVISTADSLNGSSSDFITGANRVLSHVYAPEGFRRDRLREIRHDLSQFIKTLQPGVFKVLWTTLRSLQKVLKEGPENLPPHLKRLFDEKTLSAFKELSQVFKLKKEKYHEERKEEEKNKKNEKEMTIISEFEMIEEKN